MYKLIFDNRVSSVLYYQNMSIDIDLNIKQFSSSNKFTNIEIAIQSAEFSVFTKSRNSNYVLNTSQPDTLIYNTKIDNLKQAYSFAYTHKISEQNILYCHSLISKQLLSEHKLGKYRDSPIGVYSNNKLVFTPVNHKYIRSQIKSHLRYLNMTLKSKLSFLELFYRVSVLHLNFVTIHPFCDGNGRMARLLDKWLLSRCLGDLFWSLPIEQYYSINWRYYYLLILKSQKNPKASSPFLQMLPRSLLFANLSSN